VLLRRPECLAARGIGIDARRADQIEAIGDRLPAMRPKKSSILKPAS